MLNKEWIRKTEDFVKRSFDESAFLSARPEEKAYRLEHTYRVANIGLQIARKEGFDETETVIACLLHDVSYATEFGEDGWREHGRTSARMARPFLTELGMAPDRVEEICYGVAIHVDDEADFPGERTPFALTVQDADNIDRFDAYRIHETLSSAGFLSMPFEEKREYVEKRLAGLRRLKETLLATRTAEELWRERLSFQIAFYERLARQLRHSTGIGE